MTDKLNEEIKIKAKQITENLINFMQDLDTENNYQIKELQKDIEYYKSHIKELEARIAKLKCNCDCNHCIYTDSPCTPDDYDENEIGYCSHYKGIYDEIIRLEHENKQLKDKLQLNTDCEVCKHYPDNKLDKAKRIIELMLPYMPKKNIEGVYEIVEQAEEFLREIKE